MARWSIWALSLTKNQALLRIRPATKTDRMGSIGGPLGNHERGTNRAQQEIVKQPTQNMQLNEDDADGVFRQMHSLTYNITLPESALFPIIDILKSEIDRDEAEEVALMMEATARLDGAANAEQSEFIRRFRERMGLLH